MQFVDHERPPEIGGATAYLAELRLEGSAADAVAFAPDPCSRFGSRSRKRRCLLPPTRYRKKLLVLCQEPTPPPVALPHDSSSGSFATLPSRSSSVSSGESPSPRPSPPPSPSISPPAPPASPPSDAPASPTERGRSDWDHAVAASGGSSTTTSSTDEVHCTAGEREEVKKMMQEAKWEDVSAIGCWTSDEVRLSINCRCGIIRHVIIHMTVENDNKKKH